MRTTSQ